MRGHVLLSHGSDSSPEATKVSTLATFARSSGWTEHRPDYREDDAHGHAGSVVPRLERLLAAIDASPEPPVLVGSSMGAFVSGLASLERPVAGLFLLATPGAIPGYPRPFGLREGMPSMLIHGWRDDICPLEPVQALAQSRRLPLLVLDDDHRLSDSVDRITAEFLLFLDQLAVPT